MAKKKKITKKPRSIAKSEGHVCFMRGRIGPQGDLIPISAAEAAAGDYEFYVDMYGCAVYRALVTVQPPIHVVADFNAAVRVDKQTCVSTSIKAAIDLCNRARAAVPRQTKQAMLNRTEYLRKQYGIAEATDVGSASPTAPTAALSEDELPEGWRLEMRTKSTTGATYRVFHTPDGKKLYSIKKVREHLALVAKSA